MEPSSSKKSRTDEHKIPEITYGFATLAVPSALMESYFAATSSVAPSTPAHAEKKTKTKMYISPLSPSTSAEMGPSTSNIIRPSTPSMAPSTPVPKKFDWTHSRMTNAERQDFLKWAVHEGRKMADPDERKRLLRWAFLRIQIAVVPVPEASSFSLDQTLPTASQLSESPMLLRLELPAWERRMDVNARDSPRKSRFEVFSFLTHTATHLGSDKVGKVFGVISVSDKYGKLSDESHFYEPDFAHALLFNHKWCDAITPDASGLVYLGIPSSSRAVQFISSIEVRMELYVAKDEMACYQVCDHKIELDLSEFCDEKSESACGRLTVSGEEGRTHLFYILLKDAIDAFLEVSFQTKTRRKLRGYALGYYGDDFLVECECPPSDKYHYMSVLFLPSDDLGAGEIQLKRSLLAVPANGSLVISAYLEDLETGEVIMKDSCKFTSQHSGSSSCTIPGIDCQFDLKVDWKY